MADKKAPKAVELSYDEAADLHAALAAKVVGGAPSEEKDEIGMALALVADVHLTLKRLAGNKKA